MEKFQYLSPNGHQYILSFKGSSRDTKYSKQLSVELADDGPCEATEVSAYVIIESINYFDKCPRKQFNWFWGAGGKSLETICKLRHDNILRYYGFGEIASDSVLQIILSQLIVIHYPGTEHRRLCILTEKLQTKGSYLREFSKKNNLTTEMILSFASQLLEGLQYLHTQQSPIIIGNMSSDSIIVMADVKLVKICGREIYDRHRNNQFPKPDTFNKALGNNFIFPELRKAMLGLSRKMTLNPGSALTPCADIWSLGCVVLDMLTGGNLQFIDKNNIPLDSSMDAHTLIKVMLDGGKPLIPENAPDIFRKLCFRCFEQISDNQSSAAELLKFLRLEKKYETFVKGNTPHSNPIFSSPDGNSLEFKIISVVGSSNYKVYQIDIIQSAVPELLEYRSNKLPIALKVFDIQEFPEKINDTLPRLLNLQNNNVVRYISFGKLPIGLNIITANQAQCGILMEYYEGGTLNGIAQKILDEEEIIGYTLQVAAGMKHLHGLKQPIFHGDLKGENIFLTADKKTVKIGDMENCVVMENGRTNTNGLCFKEGTMWHMSPEMLNFAYGDGDAIENTHIGRASDIWSIGCIAMEMIGNGRVHYMDSRGTVVPETASPFKLMNEVMKGAGPNLALLETKKISTGFRDIIKQCLDQTREIRPLASKLQADLEKLHSDLAGSV